jgi:hypothetical protein
MRLRSTSGQAAVEYIALVALVALVFVFVGGFVLNGRAIAAATVAQIRRGLCIVEGHDCPEVHPPCAVSSRSSADDWHVDIAIVRLGAGRSAIVERMSDGRVLVTLADHVDVGATGGFGADLKIGDRIAIGGELRAAALASLGRGATYEVPDERTADELVQALRGKKTDPDHWRRLEALLPRVSAPVSRYVGASVAGSASLGVVTAGLAAGGRLDRVSGNRTVYLKGSASFDAERSGVSGGASGEAQLAITFDRHGKPTDLMALGAGELHASTDLPDLLQPIAGHLPSGAGRSWDLEAHLDLTQPGRAEAVLGSLTDPSRLVRMILADGSAQVRGYAISEDELELSGHVKVGLAIGGDISRTASSRRLVAAMDHTPEGFWVPRYDCLEAA